MTKENFASINVVIDRSGSMGHLTTDTIGSFNTFLAEQKLVPGEAVLTLCTFNEDYSLVHDFVKLASVPDLNSKTYRPAGSTALLDALGTTINSVGAKLAAMPENERPSKVIFLIITDGQENASRTFTKAQIKSMIEHQREVYSWEFVFMGANIDAVHEGSSLGIATANSVNYVASAAGTARLYDTVSKGMSSYRMSADQRVDFFNQNNQNLGGNLAGTVTPPVVNPTVDNTVPMPSTPDNTGKNNS